MAQIDRPKSYTYEDLRRWGPDFPAELLMGDTFYFPLIGPEHKKTISAIHAQLGDYIDGQGCQVLYYPTPLFLTAQKDTPESELDTVLKPDIFITNDMSRLDARGYFGVPLVVMEVLSPETFGHDIMRKMHYYSSNEVNELWLIDPGTQRIKVMMLDYKTHEYIVHGDCLHFESVKVNTLEGVSVDFSRVFPNFPGAGLHTTMNGTLNNLNLLG